MMVRSGARIVALVVDDEPVVRRMLCRLLHAFAIETREAASVDAARAWLTAEDGRCDVLVTDNQMPERSGFELIAWTRVRWPSLPVVMVTGLDEAAPSQGAAPDAVVPKHTAARELHPKIAALVAARSRRIVR